MSGSIFIGKSSWDVAGWLFYWVIEEVAKQSDVSTLSDKLQEVADQGLGSVSVDDLSSVEQAEMMRIIDPAFKVTADVALKLSRGGLEVPLADLDELIGLFAERRDLLKRERGSRPGI